MSKQKKRNFQIEGFKHIVVVDLKYADKTWKVLEHASGLSFEELYRLFNLRPLPTGMTISNDESLAQFLETEVLSVVSDQVDNRNSSAAKRARTNDRYRKRHYWLCLVLKHMMILPMELVANLSQIDLELYSSKTHQVQGKLLLLVSLLIKWLWISRSIWMTFEQ